MSWTFQEDENKVYKYCKESRGEASEKYEFEKALTFRNISRGRSAVTFWFEDEDEKLYPMFVTDFRDLLKHVPVIVKGELPELRYIHTKKGQSIGIRLVPEQLDELRES